MPLDGTDHNSRNLVSGAVDLRRHECQMVPPRVASSSIELTVIFEKPFVRRLMCRIGTKLYGQEFYHLLFVQSLYDIHVPVSYVDK